MLSGSRHKGSNRVLRGGSWNNNGHYLRSAYRNNNAPDNRNHNTGLRLAGALSNTEGGGSINQPIFPGHYGGRSKAHGRTGRQFADGPPMSRIIKGDIYATKF